MPYSLVNISALGYDLVRLPHGPHVAEVLRASLACGPDGLTRLRHQHAGPGRDTPGEPPPAERRTSSPTAITPARGASEGDAEAGTAERARRRLERAALGDVTALEDFIRHEVLEWTWLRSGDVRVQDPEHELAADVLCAAAASAYCSRELPEATRRAMASPFLAARVAADPTTGHPPVDDLLARLVGSDAAARDRWRWATGNDRPRTVDWATAMHQATWALHLSGRLRLAADAQLAAVVAFRTGGFDLRDAAYGVWNAVSAAVHATLTRDLIAERDHILLTRPWSHACGAEAARD